MVICSWHSFKMLGTIYLLTQPWSVKFSTTVPQKYQELHWRLQWSRGSVLPFGTQVRGFKPDWSHWFIQGEKILSTPSFKGEVKPSVPCHRFTACKRYLNVTWKSGIFRQISSAISRPCSPPLAARISWRRQVAKGGKFENKKVHKRLHLWPLGPHRRRLAVISGTSKGSTISQYACSTFGALATEAQ